MFKNSTLVSSSSKRKFSRLNSIENHSFNSKQSISIQTDLIEKSSKSTNTPNYVDEMLKQGKNMNDKEFEKFIKDLLTFISENKTLIDILDRAFDCYWKILAERARIKLDDELRENRQLHELLDDLTKENDELRRKNEHCGYLTNVFNSITSEYDSGIELHINDESPMTKRQKTHI